LYSLTCSGPDICFSVAILSQYLENPSESHLEAGYGVLADLKKSANNGITFLKPTKAYVGPLIITAYGEADLKGPNVMGNKEVEHKACCRSTSRTVIQLNYHAPVFLSKKKNNISIEHRIRAVCALTDPYRSLLLSKNLKRNI
jgi:hypothetical protein